MYDVFADSCQTHPHHTYIQLASETGLIGLILFTLFILIVLILFIKELIMKFFKDVPKYDFLIMICGSILINFNPFLPSGSFFNNWLSLLYYLPIALLFSFNKLKYLYEKN